MNRAEIRSHIRSLINEPVEGNWLDIEINYWINEAINDISVKARCLLKHYTFDTVASTGEYNLPADFISAQRVRYDIYLLKPISIRDIDKLYPNSDWTLLTATKPDYYYIKFGSPTYKIGIFKIPASVLSCTVDYTALANELNDDTTEPELHAQFQKLIIPYCVYKALMKDTRPDEASNFLNEYLFGIEDMKKQLKGNQVDRLFVMKSSDKDDAPKEIVRLPSKYGTEEL